MTVRLCWNCSRDAHMTRQGNAYMVLPDTRVSEERPLVAFFKCDNCHYPSAAIGGSLPSDSAKTSQKTELINHEHSKAVLSWIPGSAEGKDFPDVPQHIASAASEAYRCRSFGALRAALLLARSVIEATCKDKGIVSGSLASKIDSMMSSGHLRAHTKDAAHEIRHMGNDMAHGDFVNPVTEEDAEEMLELMSEVLNEVFQGPERIARARLRRETRSAQG